MLNVLLDLPFVKVYLEYMIIHSAMFFENIEYMHTVMEWLRKPEFYVKLCKFKFFQPYITFLTHNIDAYLYFPQIRSNQYLSGFSYSPYLMYTHSQALSIFHCLLQGLADIGLPLVELTHKLISIRPFQLDFKYITCYSLDLYSICSFFQSTHSFPNCYPNEPTLYPMYHQFIQPFSTLNIHQQISI